MSGAERESAAVPRLDMPLDEAMRTQRSIRRIKPDPVDDTLIPRILELALKAPTCGGRRTGRS